MSGSPRGIKRALQENALNLWEGDEFREFFDEGLALEVVVDVQEAPLDIMSLTRALLNKYNATIQVSVCARRHSDVPSTGSGVGL